MTPISDNPILPTPVRRRTASAVPVLIQIPNLTASRSPGRGVRRRRLRREVRVVGYALIAILPISLMVGFLGGNGLPDLAASSLAAPADQDPDRSREVPAVSLSLEPVASVPRDLQAPVFLPGILLPADSTEEDGDGRY